MSQPLLDGYTAEDYRNAISGRGPLAYDWEDKPHRLLYDLLGVIAAGDDRRDALAEALRRSAEALHGTSNESVHLRHTFAECPDYHCAGARDALEAAR